MKTLKDINEGLCHKAGTINEFVLVPVKDVQCVREAANSSAAAMYRAKVGHADKVNQNDRIYPRELWAVQIDRCKAKMKEGKLTGAVDHPSWGGGAMKDTCIKWHSMQMEADGSVFGEFSIITKHSRGADLQALVDADVAIGFSTRGIGSARRPTDDEKKRYGLPEDGCFTVVIDEDYELKKIDSVDDPSVDDAYIDITPPASAGDDAVNQPPIKENSMKTLEELKTQNADLFKLHEGAIGAAVTAATTPLNEQIAKLTGERDEAKKLVDSINAFIESNKSIKLLNIPFRETTTAEVTAKLEAATTATKTANDALAAEKAKREAAEAKLSLEEGKRLDSDRHTAVLGKIEDALKDNAFAEQLAKLVKGEDGKGGKIEDAKFDVAALEAFVADKTAEYEAIAPKAERGLTGTGNPPAKTGQGAGAGKGKTTAEDVRKSFSL